MNRSAIYLVIAFLALSNAQGFLSLPTQDDEIQVPTLNGTKANLIQFYTALWGYYGLNQTVGNTCYSDITAQAYFQTQGLDWLLSGAMAAANRTAVAIYQAQIIALNATLSPAADCVHGSQDFQNLLNKVGVNITNQTEFDLIMRIYGEAHYGDYYLAFTPVYNLLNQGQYTQAGIALGPVFQQTFANASLDNIMFSAFKSFQNGIFYWLNLSVPYQLSSCYDNNGGATGIQFYYLWSQAIANTTAANASAASSAYFDGIGGTLLQQLQTINQCMEQTQDQERLNAAVGYDVHSSTFDTAIDNYIKNQQNVFWYIFNAMYQYFQQRNPEAAGILYGQFYLNVAASITNEF